MRIIIVCSAQELGIDAGDKEPVIEIKRKIESLLCVPVESQTLSVSGWELVDGLDMEDYPIITDGTKIDLFIRSTPSPLLNKNHCSKMHVTVKFSSKQINVEVDKTDTVRSLKEKIHILERTPIKRMVLFFSGVELEDDFRNLSEYGIHEFSEIIAFHKSVTRLRDDPPTRKIKMVVQTSSSLLNSASIPLEMKDSSTVNDIRQLLLSRKILPQDEYLFVHKQRIMRDQCSLRWHGVDNGDCIYVFKGTVSQSEF